MFLDLPRIDTTRPSLLVCRYSFGPGNNAALVERVLTSRPWWSQTEDENDFNLRWQQLTPPPMRFNSMCSTARKTIFNHLPGNGVLHSKVTLYQILLRKLGHTALDFLPVTYILTVPAERDKFKKHFKALAAAIAQQSALQATEDETNAEKREQDTTSEENESPSQTNQTTQSSKVTDNAGTVAATTSRSKISIEAELSATPVQTNMRNLWIVKPIGLNRGRGIKVVTTPDEAIAHMQGCQERAREERIREPSKEEKAEPVPEQSPLDKILNVNTSMSFIVQKYMEDPFLISERKFDIRTYSLITSDGDGYIYEHGYLRLSSAKYSLDTTDTTVHLTNNAVQKNISGYNQFEDGNMLHFRDLDAHMHAYDSTLSPTHFTRNIWPTMKRIMAVVLLSFRKMVLGAHSSDGCFELFGFDFMIDGKSSNYRPMLIEINSNPCLALSSIVSWELLPKMLDDLMDLTVDKLFPAPRVYRDEMVRVLSDSKSSKGSKKSTVDGLFTGKPESLAALGGLRWDCLRPDGHIVTRKNMFTNVMSRWKPNGGESDKQSGGEETKMLHSVLSDPAFSTYRPACGFMSALMAQSGVHVRSTKSCTQKTRTVLSASSVSPISTDKPQVQLQLQPGRSETCKRKQSQKKAVLTSRSLSNAAANHSSLVLEKDEQALQAQLLSPASSNADTTPLASEIAVELVNER